MSDSEEQNKNPKFSCYLKCLPLENRGKKKVERGGKILLPASALEDIEFLNINYPLTFKITNEQNDRSTHVGVFEFTSQEEHVSIPRWLMINLDLKANSQVKIESVSLPSATYCKLQPLTRNFAYAPDVKSVLEQNFQYFACLTEGDVIFVHELNKNLVYKMRVVETKPESAVSIFDCEMEVDLDIPEKPKRKTTEKVNPEPAVGGKSPSVFQPFQGKGYSLNGQSNPTTEKKNASNAKKRKNEGSHEDEPKAKKNCKEEDGGETSVNQLLLIRQKQKEFYEKQKKSFIPFDGPGHSLKKD